jgi:AcrR family transcriptional regulator
MGVNERKQKEKEELKNKIRAAAIEQFLSDGVENFTIRKIAEKIEYAPATIYLYYKDKTDILMDLHKEGFTILLGYLKGVSLSNEDDLIRHMREQAIAYIDFALDNPEYYHLIFIMSYKQKGLNSPDEWTEGRIAYDLMRTNISKCIERGIIKSANIEEIAFASWAFLHGLASLIGSQTGGPAKIEDKKSFAAKAIDFFYNNLKNNAAPNPF